MEQLVVRLGSDAADPVHWIVWSEQQQEIIASGELASASDLHTLAERAGQRPVTALVPSCDVLLKWVIVPARAGRKALDAIPFMLEDELSGDIDQQFFALGDKKGEQQAVAVVHQDSMQGWLQRLKEAGLYCTKLIPDILALPLNPQGWSLLSVGDQLLLREDEWQGLQGEQGWICAAISHYARQQDTPLTIAKYTSLELPHLTNVNMQEQSPELPMQLLVAGALSCKFNLLQGRFKIRKKSTGKWQQWRLAAILAAVALLTSLLDKGIELYQLQQQQTQLKTQIETEYRRAFPSAKRIVNVRSQMRQQLRTMEQGGNSISMLVMMSQLSQAFANSKVKPQTVRFDRARGELRMQAVASNFEALEQFKRAAEATGFRVEQGAINNKDNQVIGSLSIRS